MLTATRTFDAEIATIANRIHTAQADMVRAQREIDAADDRMGRVGSVLQLARAKGTRERPDLERRHAEAFADVAAKKAAHGRLETQLFQLHQELSALHERRRLFVALGGQSLELPPLPAGVRQDADLDRLIVQESQLIDQLATVGARLSVARAQSVATAARVQELRVARYAPKSKTGDRDIQAANADAEIAARAEASLTADLGALDAALGDARAAREAREADRAQRVGPAIHEEYRRRVSACVQTLRAAVLASEALWQLYPLAAETRHVPVTPWPELRVLWYTTRRPAPGCWRRPRTSTSRPADDARGRCHARGCGRHRGGRVRRLRAGAHSSRGGVGRIVPCARRDQRPSGSNRRRSGVRRRSEE